MKAHIWAENLALKFDEFCNEAYEKAKAKLNGLPQNTFFLEQFPIAVKSKPEPVEKLELEEGSTLESLYKDHLMKIKNQAVSFIDRIIGRAALERPELLADMF